MSDSEDSKRILDYYEDEHFSNETGYNSAPAFEWSEEKCLELIREYRERPILWDPKEKGYYKNNLKSIAWEDIGNTVGYPAEACKGKMIILLSSFRREKAKIINSVVKGKGHEMYISNWFGFKDLSFLMDKDLAHKRRSMGEDLLEERTGEQLHYKGSRNTNTQHVTNDVASSSSSSQQIAIVQTFSQTPKHTAASNARMSRSSKTNDEEMSSFLNFIGNKISKYDEHTKNEVQRAICDVIFKVDQQYYKKCNHSKRKRSYSSSDDDPLTEHK